MTQITVAKDDAGRMVGLTAEDQRAWSKFWDMVGAMEQGEFCTVDVWFPRNPKLHRFHFALIGGLFDAQDRFLRVEALRAWLYVGAGYCEFLPGPDGLTVAIPKSIKWSEVDDEDFKRVHQAMMEFLAGDYCRAHLWPRMSEPDSAELLSLLIEQFELA